MNLSKRTNNRTRGTNKNSLLGLRSRTLSRHGRETEIRRLGRMIRNWVKVQKTHELEQSMVRHGDNEARTLGKSTARRNFGETCSAYKNECGKR